jgi:CRISPR/Cas system-associated exonuclease Cas4 (RecB family)
MTTESEIQNGDPNSAEERPTNPQVEALLDAIDGAGFAEWYREREFARNIREGQPYFNGPGRTPAPNRHSPSQLLQCHRKALYRQHNAPEEEPDPQGIFWIGSRFEEEIIVPYLASTIGENEYVRNSMWIDFTCKTSVGEIRIKGETDPVIVDRESEPLLLTESKTKRTIDTLDSPEPHHVAQTHCYLYGLTQMSDRRVTDALLLYGSRTSLDLKAFHVEFDPWFWRQVVLGWAGNHTQLRLDETLPPADPEQSWECDVCSYSHRCGEADKTPFRDVDTTGLLPRFEYPKAKVVDYLDSHDGARLTPTLARRYPDLTEQYGVHDWKCECCSRTYEFEEFDADDAITHDNDLADTPLCPSCASDQYPVPLTGPPPSDQPLPKSHT